MSVDTWRTQLRDFATQVMGVDAQQPTYVAGNSLGGLLAVRGAVKVEGGEQEACVCVSGKQPGTDAGGGGWDRAALVWRGAWEGCWR